MPERTTLPPLDLSHRGSRPAGGKIILPLRTEKTKIGAALPKT